MAKDKRFPSPANVAVDKDGKPVAAKAPAAPMPGKPVMGKAQELAQVQYDGEGPVILHNGVHALAKGLNHIAKEVWAEAQKHPHIAALIKAGKIKISGEKAAPAAEESAGSQA